MNPRYYFLDTNILMHFSAIEEIDWEKILDSTSTTLLLAPVIVRELDKHKDNNSSAKLKQRARSVLKKLEKWLDGADQATLRNGVTLLYLSDEPPEEYFSKNRLSPSRQDDELLASMLAFRNHTQNGEIFVITDDTSLRLRAQRLKFQVYTPPDELRLKDDADATEKRVRELEAQIAKIERARPAIELKPTSSNSNRVEATLQTVRTLPEAQVSKELFALRRQYPIRSEAVELGLAGADTPQHHHAGCSINRNGQRSGIRWPHQAGPHK